MRDAYVTLCAQYFKPLHIVSVYTNVTVTLIISCMHGRNSCGCAAVVNLVRFHWCIENLLLRQ